MIQLSVNELQKESPACRLAVQRAENWERESRTLGVILVGLVAVVALALAIAVGLAVIDEPAAAIATVVGGIVDGLAAVWVVRRRKKADESHEDAINDAKAVCSPPIAQQLA